MSFVLRPFPIFVVNLIVVTVCKMTTKYCNDTHRLKLFSEDSPTGRRQISFGFHVHGGFCQNFRTVPSRNMEKLKTDQDKAESMPLVRNCLYGCNIIEDQRVTTLPALQVRLGQLSNPIDGTVRTMYNIS